MVKETDRAWAAGYFDGEGHVGYTHPSDRNVGRINLSVSQKDRRSLDRFAQIVGVGKVYERDASVPYQWAATNVADKFAALKVLWPYLDEIKRAAAADAWAQYVIDRTPKPPAPLVHGKSSTYCGHACRCEACTVAHRVSTRHRAQKKRGAPTTITSGEETILTNAGLI